MHKKKKKLSVIKEHITFYSRQVDSFINKIIEGDCIEKVKELPDGSLDLIICDGPFGVTEKQWDKVTNFKSLTWNCLNYFLKN
ncbi:MAG: hypothetical protein AB1349_12705 [Elusimicrobiota bacterium]